VKETTGKQKSYQDQIQVEIELLEKIDNAIKDLNEEEKKLNEQETVIDSIPKNVVVETKETNDDVPIPWENWDGPKEPKEMNETV
jgi:hypothetical protein